MWLCGLWVLFNSITVGFGLFIFCSRLADLAMGNLWYRARKVVRSLQ
jgi:hypothetical protein